MDSNNRNSNVEDNQNYQNGNDTRNEKEGTNNGYSNYNNYSNQSYHNDNIKKLYRSRNDKMLCGVCGGLANYFKCDPTIVRLLFVFLAFCSCGTALIAYIVMAIVVPEPPFNE